MHTLREPLFKGAFRVFVGGFSEVERYLKVRNLWDGTMGVPKLAKAIAIEKDGRHEVLFWFQSGFNPRRPEDMAILAHEALHGVIWVLQHRDVPDVAILDEAGTYYVEWLVREIAKRVLRRVRA